MNGQDNKQIVEEKCKLIDKVEAENPGLRVFGVDVNNIPLQALQEYAAISGEELKYHESKKAMRIHYGHFPYCIFLSSKPVTVETRIIEGE